MRTFWRQRADAAGLKNVTFRVGDAASVSLDHDFDAVVGRCVLFFIQDRLTVLRRLVESVRRGGVIAFQEPGNATLSPSALPPSPLVDQIWRWIMELYRKTGMDLYAGLRLFSLFEQANLLDPQMHLDAAVGGGPDWPGYEYIAGLVRTILPRLVEQDIVTAADVNIDSLADRLRDENRTQQWCGYDVELHYRLGPKAIMHIKPDVRDWLTEDGADPTQHDAA